MDPYCVDKLKSIFPIFYENNLNDVFTFVIKFLFENQKDNFKINNWTITFDSSFDIFSLEKKYTLLRKIEKKYLDFDNIIHKTSSKMKHYYCESGKSNLYVDSVPCNLEFRHLTINDNIKFTIIVEEIGKRNCSYFRSAGKLNVCLL
jgi:hypothetical protein